MVKRHPGRVRPKADSCHHCSATYSEQRLAIPEALDHRPVIHLHPRARFRTLIELEGMVGMAVGALVSTCLEEVEGRSCLGHLVVGLRLVGETTTHLVIRGISDRQSAPSSCVSFC